MEGLQTASRVDGDAEVACKRRNECGRTGLWIDLCRVRGVQSGSRGDLPGS